MKLNVKLAVLAMLFFNVSLFAQDGYVLTGTVVDGENTPLIGVSVLKANTSSGTVTDFDGKYQINVNTGDVLRFSYTGFSTQSVTTSGQTQLDIVLEIDSELLEEVVVVGYGTRKVSHNTGAIAQVGGAALAAVQVARVDEALAGKLSGVLIQNQDASPGAAPKIQIRAASSISGDANPLIVVDGFPISGSLATVNPNDIQSLEVLKDAASAAIYGSRGANGVILITTKQGKTGKPSVSYNSYVSTSSRYLNENKPVGNADWANTLEANVADGTFNISEIDPDIYQYKLNAYRNNPDVVAVEDWLFQNGNTVNHDLSIGGGSEDVRYYASVGYLDTEGIVQTQGFKRYNTRLNVDANLTDRFKAGLSFNGFIGDRDIEGHDQRDLLRAYSVHPIYHTAESIAFVQNLDQQAQALGLSSFDSGYRGGSSPFNSSIYSLEPGMSAQDWHYGRSGNGIGGSGDAGPATKLDNTDRFEKTYFGNINSYLQYEIADGLNIRTVLGGDMRDTREYFWRGLEFDSRGRTTQTALQESNVKRTSVLSETTVNYATVLGGRHDISAVAGLEFQNFFIKGIALNGTNVPFGQPENFALLNPADVSISERDETIARRSVFGRVNYAFDNRYLFSLSVRRDGDSRFGANNRFEVFPAVSVGWNLHNEAFYNSEFLTDVKARFSYGSLGTTSFLGAYNSLSLLNPQATIFGNGFLIPSDVANPDLTWQTNTEANLGLNLGFLENRFRFAIDYYTSEVKDILINQSVSEVLGTTSIALNSGDVLSSGLELDLGAAVINSGDFRWDLSANFSTVQTEITDLGGLDELAPTIYGQSGRGPVFRNYIGGEIGEMWGIQTTGLVEMKHLSNPIEFVGQESGYSYAVDQNGDGVIDRTRTVAEGGDLVKIGQNTPDFYYGISSQFSFREFDASFQFQGASGGEVYNIDPLYYGSQWGRSLLSSFDSEGDGIADANGQLYVRNRDQTDAMIQSASYLALRNITVGYTFRPSLAGDRQPSVRVYAAASNLLYLVGDNYTSFNPEGVETTNGGYLGPTTYGIQVGASPIVRSFSLGLNVNF